MQNVIINKLIFKNIFVTIRTANLMYMKHFHQAKVFEDDEFR